MKIIFANNYYYIRGGAERVFFDEMQILREKGHYVLPFSRHFSQNIENLKYFAPPIDYENVPIYKRPFAAFSLIYSPTCARYFGKLLDRELPDIVHGHNIYGRLTTSIIHAAKKRNIPVVLTLHDYKLICPSYLMLREGKICELCKGKRFYYCLLKRCHKDSFFASAVYTVETYFNFFTKKYDWVRFFICPSKFLLQKCIEGGISEHKLVYVPNFIRVEEFKPLYDNKGYILFVGRLSKEKGILTLLKAVQDIDVELKVVGDGPIRRVCERFIKENNIKNVSFEGYKSGDELKNLYRNAIFVVFPSEWYENAPMSVLESFAYGKPVVGANIGGVPEMVKNGETGLLFTPGDHRELREKIIYLLKQPSFVNKLGQKARRVVEQKYNAERHYENLIRVYTKVLEQTQSQ